MFAFRLRSSLECSEKLTTRFLSNLSTVCGSANSLISAVRLLRLPLAESLLSLFHIVCLMGWFEKLLLGYCFLNDLLVPLARFRPLSWSVLCLICGGLSLF